MTTLYLDIETYSDLDLKKVGVYKYTSSPEFKIILTSYAWDNNEVQVEEGFPRHLEEHIEDPKVIKVAHNAMFERVCISQVMRTKLAPYSWDCTMVQASYNGRKMALKDTGEKMDGSEGLNKFCKPHKGVRIMPEHAPEAWHNFKEYCKQDVVASRNLYNSLERIPPQERVLYQIDQLINDNGVAVNEDFLNHLMENASSIQDTARDELVELTGCENPRSRAQMTIWLKSQGYVFKDMTRETLEEAMKTGVLPENIYKVLELYLVLSSTASAKFEKMKNALIEGKLFGMFRFYGAHTGRWSSSIVQLHNLPRITTDTNKNYNTIMEGGTIKSMSELIQLVRLVFSPKHDFVVSDFTAIEAVVLSWLANEKWRLDVFRGHGKIYEASASQMFGMPIDKVTKPIRQKGKIAELALGYGGGANALQRMGALKMGLKEVELLPLVTQWREANPSIVRFWREIENACKAVVAGTRNNVQVGKVLITHSGSTLQVMLPSRRKLMYPEARLKGLKLVYKSDYAEKELYGGLLVENITQAIARDLLANAIKNLHDAEYTIRLHVHDEVVVDTLADEKDNVQQFMLTLPDWAVNLPLRAVTTGSRLYKK